MNEPLTKGSSYFLFNIYLCLRRLTRLLLSEDFSSIGEALQ